VSELAIELRERWASVPVTCLAHRIDPLPRAISLIEAEALRRGPRPEGDDVATLAVGGDELQPIDVGFDTSPPTFVIAGPPRSGRSTALAAVAATLRRPLVVIAPRPSPLRELDGDVLALYTSAERAAAELGELLDEADGPVAVLVDDAELLAEGPVAGLLQQVVREGRDHDIVLVAAATTDDLMLLRYRGWLAEARRSRCGLLLCPGSSMDGEVFDVKLPRSLSGGWPAGRGLLIERGTTAMVQVVEVRC
jgi:S-DNA-T family DNA segregation ATPase FtsK/SpoIIIE